MKPEEIGPVKSDIERAMAATLKNLESKPKEGLEGGDYEQEVRRRQYDKFRELIRDKVRHRQKVTLYRSRHSFSTTKVASLPPHRGNNLSA